MSATLAGLRPRNNNVDGITEALDAIEIERWRAEQRLVELRSAHHEALADPTKSAKHVLQLETAAKESAIEIERLGRLRGVLEAKLPAAVEAEKLTALDKQNAEADAACAAFRAALADYDAAAGRIAQICELGREAEVAVRRAVQTGQALGRRVPFDLPTVAGGRLMFSDVVMLPAMVPDGARWGDLPAPVPPVRY